MAPNCTARHIWFPKCIETPCYKMVPNILFGNAKAKFKTVSKMLKQNVECAQNEVEGLLNEANFTHLFFV